MKNGFRTFSTSSESNIILSLLSGQIEFYENLLNFSDFEQIVKWRSHPTVIFKTKLCCKEEREEREEREEKDDATSCILDMSFQN